MCRKLQQNFDVIRYLVENLSPAEATWHKDAFSRSLGEIVCHLRDMEILYTHLCLPRLSYQAHAPLSATDSKRIFPEHHPVPPDYRQAFQEYVSCRQEILNFLQNLSPHQWQDTVDHPRFGSLRLTELVEKIDAHDRNHIQQMEEIIYTMPLNPLLVRAMAEIRDYHSRYRSYLAQMTSLLDIGVGAGLALQYVMQQNPHLICTGVDVRDLRLPQVDVPLQLYDGYTLPFARDQFDVALLFYVLHHCQSPGRVLDEAVRVTRRYILLIEEFDQPGADEVSLDVTERQSHRALGLPSDLPYHLFDKLEFEAMLHARNLTDFDYQLLPSKTSRPIWKYLYIVSVNR